MSGAYFDDVFVEAMLDGENWERIPDVIDGSIAGSWGIPTNDILERMGRPAKLSFAVDNGSSSSVGANGYTPGHPDVIAGWGTGTRVRAGWTFEGFTVYLAAQIKPKGITTDPNRWGHTNAQVEAVGWLRYLSEAELELIAYETDLALEDVAQRILDNMDEQPLNVLLNSGAQTFQAAFDTLQPGDQAMKELAKAVISEFGYAYTRRDRTDGETFVVEGAYTRSGTGAADNLPLGLVDSFLIEAEDGFALEGEDGFLLVGEGTEEAVFTNESRLNSPEAHHGDGLINFALAATYPRDVKASINLWQTNRRIRVGPGQTVPAIRGSFRDPEGGAQTVVGKNVTVTYDMNTQEDGGGADFTVDLVVESEQIGAKDVQFDLRNSHPNVAGWVNVTADGDGVYIYDKVEREARDQASIDLNGRSQASVDLFYLDDPLEGLAMAQYIVSQSGTAWLRPRAWEFLANQSARLMMAWLFMDVGNRVSMVHDYLNIAGIYAINGIEFWMQPGNVLYYRWITTEADASEWFLLDESLLVLDRDSVGAGLAPF